MSDTEYLAESQTINLDLVPTIDGDCIPKEVGDIPILHS